MIYKRSLRYIHYSWSYLIEMVRYMEVTRAQLPMGRDSRKRGWRKLPRGPSSKPRDL